MEIIDLSPEYENAYCQCLEEWSDEMAEAGSLKREWLEKKRGQGLRVKLAQKGPEEIVGMIHYLPIEHAPALGQDLNYVYCIWVHGYPQGVGNWQNRGIGTRLLEAAEQDARELGAKGIAAWGILLPFFMRSKWFRRHGYRRADRDGMLELVWKPFTADASPPQLIRRRKVPQAIPGRVTVSCFRNGWCPAQNLACERMKRAVAELGGGIDYREIDTENRANLLEWGIADAIFVDGRAVATGPPPSYDKLRKILRRKLPGKPA
jgi:GNAT superfamily N-acetyltransferase